MSDDMKSKSEQSVGKVALTTTGLNLFARDDDCNFIDIDEDVFDEPKSAEVKKFRSHESSLSKFVLNGLCAGHKSESATPTFKDSKCKEITDFSMSMKYDNAKIVEVSPTKYSRTCSKSSSTVDVFDDPEKYVAIVKNQCNFQADETANEDAKIDNEPKFPPLQLDIDCSGNKVLFIRLENLLICEAQEEMQNLHILMRIRKSKRKNSKKKNQIAQYTFIYLRPFMKPFLKYLTQNFKLILFSYKDSKTVEAITETINSMFDKDVFEAYVSLPKMDGEPVFNLELFLNSEESRTRENCFIIDTNSTTWTDNKSSTLPMTFFDGFPNDNTLFLCEKFIERSIVNGVSLQDAIDDAFYQP